MSRFGTGLQGIRSKTESRGSKGTAIAAPGLWKFIEDWLRRLGLPGLIALACISVWWQWDHISKLPAIEPLIARITEKALPRAVPGKFNIAVAHFEGDENRETERLVLEGLAEFRSVATLSFDRLIASEQGDREKAEREGHERARTLLEDSGADVLIWGVVLKHAGERVPKLYWTPASDVRGAPSGERYRVTEDLRLPGIFWSDVTNVLALLVETSNAEFAAQSGRYTADRLEPFIARVRGLLQSSKAEQWSASTRAQVWGILGTALRVYGEQSGQNEPLREAVASYREALKEYTRDKAPLDWARTQKDLGDALRTLGEQEQDPARLTEAVAAYREAAKEYTREKVPLDWATTRNGLGNAFAALGERESDPARLAEAVAAYREALKEYTREKQPLNWAMTQNNLGTALGALGERESGPARLIEAVAAYREALREFTREKVPLDWAMTQNNLGYALAALGERESDPARLTEAVAAYREALKEYTREKVPLNWAMTQNNLGIALAALGERELDPARLTEAVAAYREALKEYTREKMPLDWVRTQNNLGDALQTLGKRESDSARLTEAVAAYREALEESTREKVPLQWARTQYNLGKALWTLGERESDLASLEESAGAYQAALNVFRVAKASFYAQLAEQNLEGVQRAISEQKGGTSAVAVRAK